MMEMTYRCSQLKRNPKDTTGPLHNEDARVCNNFRVNANLTTLKNNNISG